MYTSMQLRWQIRRGAHFQRILISVTARTLSLRRLRDSARGQYPGRLRRPAGSRARAGARRNIFLLDIYGHAASGTRARAVFRFFT